MTPNEYAIHMYMNNRFFPKVKVDPETGCWVWTASRSTAGYGRFWDGKRIVQAHRWSYEQWVGSIPEGMYLDHFACERRNCVNPRHVRPASPRENVLRGDTAPARNRAKMVCTQGHPYSDANTWTSKDGERHCRTCNRVRQQAIRDRKKMAS